MPWMPIWPASGSSPVVTGQPRVHSAGDRRTRARGAVCQLPRRRAARGQPAAADHRRPRPRRRRRRPRSRPRPRHQASWRRPPPIETPPLLPESTGIRTIVIDPGHGGTETGRSRPIRHAGEERRAVDRATAQGRHRGPPRHPRAARRAAATRPSRSTRAPRLPTTTRPTCSSASTPTPRCVRR